MRPKSKLYRFFEIIPGVLIWSTLVGAIVLSAVRPLWALYLIILFDLYWLLRVAYFIFYLSLSWKRFSHDTKIDWLDKITKEQPDFDRLWHLVFLPTAREGIDVLRGTLKGLANTNYPKEKFIVVLAGEQRYEEQFSRIATILKEEFRGVFGEFLVTLHPANLPGEIPSKGSNLYFAGHEAKKYIDERKIVYEDVIVSAFDSDTITHPQYFAYLAYKYLTTPNPLRASYQPIALYNNNMWDAPAIVRIAALGTTFWLMTELPRSERLFTFSSHSMPFQALVDVDFWEKDIVTEDSRIFLQCFLRYDGNYRVVPLYIPVSMDTVATGSYLKSLKALYVQQRRWGWGIEHFPYMLWNFLHNRKIPARKKWKFLWNLGEGMYSWATAPILIFLLGHLPFIFGDGLVSSTVLFQTTPLVLAWLMRAAMAGMIVSAILTSKLLPPRPPNVAIWRTWHILWQWLLLPFTLILFGSIPAFDAQTRLMIGKPLGFTVTDKVRKKQNPISYASKIA